MPGDHDIREPSLLDALRELLKFSGRKTELATCCGKDLSLFAYVVLQLLGGGNLSDERRRSELRNNVRLREGRQRQSHAE